MSNLRLQKSSLAYSGGDREAGSGWLEWPKGQRMPAWMGREPDRPRRSVGGTDCLENNRRGRREGLGTTLPSNPGGPMSSELSQAISTQRAELGTTGGEGADPGPSQSCPSAPAACLGGVRLCRSACSEGLEETRSSQARCTANVLGDWGRASTPWPHRRPTE